jgi:alpha-beta hydrolase superfamily lysophospholipase
VDDPACGFVLRAGSIVNLMAGAREARKKAFVVGIPSDLPIYVFAGQADPVHGEEKGLNRLLKRYRAQVRQVDYRLYPEGRHEMLNETNRDEVIADLVGWLRQTLL